MSRLSRMWSIELPISGPPTVSAVALDERNSEFVKMVAWSNGMALYMAKNPAPISPTRPLNPHAPWMQGVGYLVVRDAVTKQVLPVQCVDNAMECLAAYNAWKKEDQHQCLFPGSVGDLVGAAEQRLAAAALRTKFESTVQDIDEAGAQAGTRPRKSAKTWFR